MTFYKKIVEYFTKLCYAICNIGDLKVKGGIMKGRYEAIDIAKWFVWKNQVERLEKEDNADDDDYDIYEGLSHLKLQKLLYFAQGVNLAINKEPLFGDEIFAWQHGPVVQNVYKEFCGFGRDEIKINFTDEDLNTIKSIEEDNDVSTVLNLVYDEYGIYTAWQLREMSHVVKGPWETTVREKGKGSKISLQLIKEYFEENVIESV